MCTIMYKPRDVKLPSDWRVILRRLFTKNNQGAGIMFMREDGRIEIRKGYKSVTKLISAIAKIDGDLDTEIAVHCRIATSGGDGDEMTHPFPITLKRSHQLSQNLACGAAIMHNGVITKFEDKEDKYSDSANLAHSLASFSLSEIENNESLKKLVSIALGSSRMIMFTRNTTEMFGSWETDKHGLMYSNKDYEEPKKPIKTTKGTFNKDDNSHIKSKLPLIARPPSTGYCNKVKDFPDDYDVIHGKDMIANLDEHGYVRCCECGNWFFRTEVVTARETETGETHTLCYQCFRWLESLYDYNSTDFGGIIS